MGNTSRDLPLPSWFSYDVLLHDRCGRKLSEHPMPHAPAVSCPFPALPPVEFAQVEPAAGPGEDVRAEAHQAIYDLIVDHPMWIGDDGEGLEYLPEREARIGDFLDAVLALPAVAEALALRGRVEALADRYEVAPHDHGIGDGHSACAACWVDDLRRALGEDGQ